ncbi:hypothetical protein QAD02_022527 [Eretmocerus hayati]|uniref:Uncharacterized protein n=1 Tax=Eretmocerus hayati TaxID=131215 RepID=A0ACC2PUD3_9HYME|nr:hypothetical protein QAD02_022527 [Eretmocerus hayati]
MHFTELKPVEHSRLSLRQVNSMHQGNEDENDCSDTDGLRLLRSFTSPLSHHSASQHQSLQHQKIRGKHPLDELDYLDVNRHRELANDNSDDEDDDEEEEEEYVNGDLEYVESEPTTTTEPDEVYEYQQSETTRLSVVNQDKLDEDEEEDQQQPLVVPVKRRRGRPRKDPKALQTSKKAKNTTSEVESRELSSKIDDILKASYLLERENNNVVAVENSNQPCKLPLEIQKSKSKHDNEAEVDVEKDDSKGFKRYRCEICPARFKGSGGLRNHYKVVHSTGPLFKCNECGKEFPLKERLKLHVRTHTGFKPYKCEECDKTFARGGQLVQHRRTHSQLKPYSCDLCSGTFTCAANLALHLKRHSGQKDHKCDICGRGFVRRDALKKHLECLHRDVKSFLCKICNKTFKGHLPQHMRTHAQDRPHGCATCGQRFAQKSQLTVHQRTHSGQRPFRCLVCWQAFAHSTALKLHTRRHTGERPFKCAECNAGFTQLPHWKKHMRCIHGRSEPYHCRRCDSFFRIKSELEAHEIDCTGDITTNSIENLEDGRPVASSSPPSSLSSTCSEMSSVSSTPSTNGGRFIIMSVERMRLLLAVLLKRISKQERLDELGFGRRLIDDVLVDSLEAAGKQALKTNQGHSELEALKANLAVFLEWTVPKEHWDSFCKMNKTPEEILETLTVT